MLSVAIVPSGQQIYLDHLAPIAELMQIPLLTVDEQEFSLTKKYYPNTKTEMLDYGTLTLEYLFENYEALFLSEIFNPHKKNRQYVELQKKFDKDLISIHCPHGFSDKGFHFKLCAEEDLNLIYGQNMLDLLKQNKALDKLKAYVLTNNLRKNFYEKNQSFYDNMVKEEILSQFSKKQQTILYAPTWNDSQESSSLNKAYKDVLESLPSHFNMIVKLHPMVELREPALYYHLTSHYQKENVLFLENFPPIYPLLAITDLYLGDMSSIGYDFLTFNKPLVFLPNKPQDTKTSYLFRCGKSISPNEYNSLYKIIERTLSTNQDEYKSTREEAYTYTFGTSRQESDLKNEIETKLSQIKKE